MQTRTITLALLLLLCIAAAGGQAPSASAQPAGGVLIAVVGDYGDGSQAEADVAALIAGWNPDFVVTTGDNNYPDGATGTIDEHIGRFYSAFIAPYTGQHGAGSPVNRFFPTLGNHDWETTAGDPPLPQPYLDYFTLPDSPGNERYYDVRLGPVHVFALDSDPREPDGVSATSDQARWLQGALAASDAPWKLVVFHHAPYSSGLHGSTSYMRWPFAEWGADAVLSGHDHDYERLLVDGLPYFVNGLGGGSRYWFLIPWPGTQVRYNADSGAMLIEATDARIDFRFTNRAGELIDSYTLEAGTPPAAAPAAGRPTLSAPRKPNPFLRPSQRRVE